jgi:hypothetical protein
MTGDANGFGGLDPGGEEERRIRAGQISDVKGKSLEVRSSGRGG